MSGDYPVTPLRSQPVDVVAWLRCEADLAGQEPPPWQMLTRAADEIERQTEIIVTLREREAMCDHLAQRNAVLVTEIDAVRKQLKEAKERNTLYLSRLQEYEAREQ